MSAPVRTVVTFSSSDFNTTEPKESYVNPECYGDDLAAWLIQELKRRGVEADDEPGAEDFGWVVSFRIDSAGYYLMVGYRPSENKQEGLWICGIEPVEGFLTPLLGWRRKDHRLQAAQAIHAVLSESPQVHEVRWHFQNDFDAGREEAGTEAP